MFEYFLDPLPIVCPQKSVPFVNKFGVFLDRLSLPPLLSGRRIKTAPCTATRCARGSSALDPESKRRTRRELNAAAADAAAPHLHTPLPKEGGKRKEGGREVLELPMPSRLQD